MTRMCHGELLVVVAVDITVDGVVLARLAFGGGACADGVGFLRAELLALFDHRPVGRAEQLVVGMVRLVVGDGVAFAPGKSDTHAGILLVLLILGQLGGGVSSIVTLDLFRGLDDLFHDLLGLPLRPLRPLRPLWGLDHRLHRLHQSIVPLLEHQRVVMSRLGALLSGLGSVDV